MKRRGLWWVNHRQRSRLGSSHSLCSHQQRQPHCLWVSFVPQPSESSQSTWPLLCWEPVCRAKWVRQLLSRSGLWWSDCGQRSGLLLLGRLSKHQQWPDQPFSDVSPGISQPCWPQLSSLPSYGRLCLSADLWGDISRPGVFAVLRLGYTVGGSQVATGAFLCPLSVQIWEQARTHAPREQSPGFTQPSS